MTVVLEASAVTKRYGTNRPAVDAVSISLAEGDLVALSGPSGSGKTTLVHLLAAFEEPETGAVRWATESGGGGLSTTRPTWAQLSFVPQALGLLDELTVADNVGLPARLARMDVGGRDIRTAELLDQLGVAHLAARRPRQCSLGEQQRVAVARALHLRPLVLLLDEPTAHQDAASTERIVDVVTTAAYRGTACLVATHDPALVAVARRRWHLVDGALEELAVAGD
jgi:putative ABC transport system ATP-binding protein